MTASLNSKKSNFLIFLCWAAYTFAYVARLNYNASMVEILSQLGTTKEAAGTPTPEAGAEYLYVF